MNIGMDGWMYACMCLHVHVMRFEESTSVEVTSVAVLDVEEHVDSALLCGVKQGEAEGLSR